MRNNGPACLFFGIIVGSIVTMIFTLNDDPNDIVAMLFFGGVFGFFAMVALNNLVN